MIFLREKYTSNFWIAYLTNVLPTTSLRVHELCIHNFTHCSLPAARRTIAASAYSFGIVCTDARVRRPPRVSERDTSATRDSCYLRRRATHANRLEAVIRGQVHAGQHNSGITRTAAYDARRLYQGYDLRRSTSHRVSPFPPHIHRFAIN
jgi:hypothetical protein